MIIVMFYIIWIRMIKSIINLHSILSNALIFSLVLVGLTPILKNLTRDVSDDTIWAFSIIMFLANLLFHDYGKNSTTHTMFPDSLSINAAISASVLLASRLDSNIKVCLQMFSAVALFALFPIFRRSARVFNCNCRIIVRFLICI
jgi:phosphatidylinositol glycan class C protein